jgi:archaellum component FlaG (FlaF/FlaG flagellin family)
MKLFMAFIFALLVAASAAAQSSRVPAQLVGKWFEGSTSILQEKNMTTGAVASRYGSSIGYTIEADGTFRYAALIKSTMYGCTTSLWNDRRGQISVDGDTVTFTPNKDYWFNSNSCYPSSNKESNKPLEGKTFNYEVGEKNGKTWLCMREVGKTKQEDILCFPRGED